MVYKRKQIFFFLSIVLMEIGFIGREASFEAYATEQKPMFFSTKSKANVRAGPSRAYPVKLTLSRAQPVEVIAEADKGLWKKIKDYSGAVGWINARMLSNSKKRNAIVMEDNTLLYGTDMKTPIARVEKHVLVNLHYCDEKGWCTVSPTESKVVGYIEKNRLWGVRKNEIIK